MLPHLALLLLEVGGVWQWHPAVPPESHQRTPCRTAAARAQVFIGPPFHTLPLAQYIDYPAFSVFFNVTEPMWGDPSQIAWTLDLGQRASHPTDSQFWVPDIPNIQARCRFLGGFLGFLGIRVPDIPNNQARCGFNVV